MNIGIYTTMPLTNNYVGVHGITYFMFPLIKELKKRDHIITFHGNIVNNVENNIFCNIMGVKPYEMSIEKDLKVMGADSDSLKNVDIMLIYNRPKENHYEFATQLNIIRYCVRHDIPVLFWDGDLWGKDIPKDLRLQLTLLRPYASDQHDDEYRNSYEFHYFTHKLNQKYKKKIEMYAREFKDGKLNKFIDHIYIGNVYQRFAEFQNVFKDLRGNIVVAGNWLKSAKKWNKSLKIKNVLFIGEIPHSCSIPLYAMSKKTHYIIPQRYQTVGMITSRVYEAAMAKCKIANNKFKKLNTIENAIKQFEKIMTEIT
jgi:hypothetical protein|tara:strand:- start:4946 stop:5884 length:939 start_codon:yes stop_codon:yes gene_type:complete